MLPMNDNTTVPAGYRLHDIEILRWGTFDGDKYHKLNLAGHSGCVTGPNRGGKSTAIDALLTLLIPPEIRHYNVAASGEGKKNERTIKTYIRGKWTRTPTPEKDYLRKPGVPSVLLAVFKDEQFGKALTLVQFHWIHSNDKHEARYLIKQSEAHIPDLRLDKNQVMNRKAFEDDGWYYGDTFTEYLGKFRAQLRIPDNRALRLLCQAVSLKDVTNLNDFVRTLMLDPCNPGELLDKLQKHYENLHALSVQINQAEQEIRLISPIVGQHVEYEAHNRAITQLTEIKGAADLYFAREHGRLLDVVIAETKLELETAVADAAQAKLDAEEALENYLKLKLQLEAHDIGKAIKQHQENREDLVKLRKGQIDKNTTYHQLLSLIGHQGLVENDATFLQIRARAIDGQNNAMDKQQNAADSKALLELKKKTLGGRQEIIDAELRQLGTRASKIPLAFLHIRERIAKELEIPEGDLPFVGELIDVAKDENFWRPTIERFLHSFALSLLVAQEHYARVSDYLDKNDLGSTLVYYPVNRGSGYKLTSDVGKIYGKLIMKPGTWAATWLVGELIRRFDHVCTEDMNVLRKESKAITPRLHGKERGERHTRYSESRGRADRTDYDILGWSNEEKRLRLDGEFRANKNEIDGLLREINTCNKSSTEARNELMTWSKIVSYASVVSHN